MSAVTDEMVENSGAQDMKGLFTLRFRGREVPGSERFRGRRGSGVGVKRPAFVAMLRFTPALYSDPTNPSVNWRFVSVKGIMLRIR